MRFRCCMFRIGLGTQHGKCLRNSLRFRFGGVHRSDFRLANQFGGGTRFFELGDPCLAFGQPLRLVSEGRVRYGEIAFDRRSESRVLCGEIPFDGGERSFPFRNDAVCFLGDRRFAFRNRASRFFGQRRLTFRKSAMGFSDERIFPVGQRARSITAPPPRRCASRPGGA